jgi:hypothetical protein
MESEFPSPYWKDLGHSLSQTHLIQLIRHSLNNTHLNIILPCTSRYSSATTRVSFTKIYYDAFWWTDERCLCKAILGIRVLAVVQLRQPLRRYKIGWRAKVLLVQIFKRFFVIPGLKITELSRCSRNDSISNDFFLLNSQTKLFIIYNGPTNALVCIKTLI